MATTRGLGIRRAMMPPPGMRRGRGAPALTHHPHSHPGSYQPSEFPGAYPDVESGDDDSGSPGDRMPSPPPGGRMMVPPAGMQPMQPMHPNDPRARQMWDSMAAENMALREDALKMRADMDQMAAEGHEIARPGWFGPPNSQMGHQIHQANETIRQKDAELYELQQSMNELFTNTSAEIASLKSKLEEATKKHEEEKEKMRKDMAGLSDYVATAKAEDGVIDDAYFKEELGKFWQALRNWTWKNCRAATLLPEAIEDEDIRMKIRFAVPEFGRLTISNSKITVMQAVVNDMLVRMVFQRYCVGLSGPDEKSMYDIERLLTSHAQGNIANEGAATLANVNKWRALSISLLTSVDPIKDLAEGNIVDCTSEIESVVYSLIPPSKRPGEQASRQLLPVVATAVRLSHMMKTQRARFDVISPMGQVFDPEWMEDASGMEDDADSELRGKMVGAVAFPAVIKWGDERGEDYHKRTVIMRAKVLCLLDND